MITEQGMCILGGSPQSCKSRADTHNWAHWVCMHSFPVCMSMPLMNDCMVVSIHARSSATCMQTIVPRLANRHEIYNYRATWKKRSIQPMHSEYDSCHFYRLVNFDPNCLSHPPKWLLSLPCIGLFGVQKISQLIFYFLFFVSPMMCNKDYSLSTVISALCFLAAFWFLVTVWYWTKCWHLRVLSGRENTPSCIQVPLTCCVQNTGCYCVWAGKHQPGKRDMMHAGLTHLLCSNLVRVSAWENTPLCMQVSLTCCVQMWYTCQPESTDQPMW
jgi:hypothetical protein